MPRRSRRFRAQAALALAAFLLLGVGANGAAQAQTTSGGSTDASQFGGFSLSSRGNGFLLSFDSPHLLPLGSPLFEVGLPEAQASQSGGPSGYALASLAYPGALVANLPAVIAQSGNDVPLPNYPAQQQAFYPSGPTEASQQIATASMNVTTTGTTSDGVANYDGSDLQSFFASGAMVVRSHTGIEDGQVVSRVHSEVDNLNILGIVTIGSITTDMVAVSNGQDADTSGTTVANGVKVLGLDATIDADGVHIGNPSASTDSSSSSAPSGPLDPLLNGAGLGSLADPLQPVAQTLSQLITSVVGATGSVNDLLQQAGITMKLLAPLATKSGGQAQRTANGLLIEINYNGRTAPLVSQLLGAVPSGQLPADPLIPQVPLNTSPQALFNLLKETYVTDLALAPGAVAVQATTPYVASVTTPSVPSTGPRGVAGINTTNTPFTTATPKLATSSTAGGETTLGTALPVDLSGNSYPVIAALLLALALMAGFGYGGGFLADNVLAATGAACPEGREAPSSTTGGR